jgi:hypothetical protein
VRHWPQGVQFLGALLVSSGCGVLFGWAIGCVIVGTSMIAVGTLAERAKMLGKG